MPDRVNTLKTRFKKLGLGLLLALLVTACNQLELYGGLSMRDANEMVALLTRNGIEASREAGAENTFRLTVKKEQFAAATEILAANGYPRETYRSLADIFPGQGLIVSPFEQRARLAFALNQEMARTISTIDGVISARVHVVVPELDMRGQPQGKTSAAVVIHHRLNADPADLAPKIRLIVANGVQGLNYRDVSLAFFPINSGHVTPAAPQPAAQQTPAPAVKVAPAAPAASTAPAAQTSAPATAAEPSLMAKISSYWLKDGNTAAPTENAQEPLTIAGVPLNIALWSAAGFTLMLAFLMRVMRRREPQEE